MPVVLVTALLLPPALLTLALALGRYEERLLGHPPAPGCAPRRRVIREVVRRRALRPVRPEG